MQAVFEAVRRPARAGRRVCNREVVMRTLTRCGVVLALLGGCDVMVDDAKSTGTETDASGETDPAGETDTTGGTGVDGDRFHPAGYAAATAHGRPAKMQELRCVTCHGSDLAGGRAPSCDDCHQEGWRTNCTYCHGEEPDGTGSPPRHISGKDDGAQASFIPHRAHTVANKDHVAFDCDQCHVKPEDVLSEGHLFVGDTTPGVAETSFLLGLGPKTAWTASKGTCSADYCHGNGRGETGSVQQTAAVATCGKCHADRTTPVKWLQMSGEHGKHLLEGIACADCHAATASGSNAIVDPELHVDGKVQVSFTEPLTWAAGSCDGDCHGENHENRGW